MDKSLYLGVSRVDITPEIGARLYGYEDGIFAKSVHDKLSATAYIFQSGDVKAVLISATVCLIKTELATRIRSEIAKELSVPMECCILSATHTHSGPCTTEDVGWGDIDVKYCEEILVPRIVYAVKAAATNMTSVKMSVTTGESFVGINRREVKIDNRSHLGQNPCGPLDPEMIVLSFANDKGEVIANIIHYGAHGTATGHEATVSRDWSGIMTDRLEELTGGVTAFFNGPEGDVGPRISNGKTVGTVELMEQLGEVAAADAIHIYGQKKNWEDVDLQCIGSTIRIPCDSRKPLETAQKEMEEFGPREGIEPRDQRTYQLLLDTIQSYKDGYEEKEYLEIPQSLVRIGNVVFISFPYELFAEMGMRIKKECKDFHILSLSNANGADGYFITEDAFCRKGYEVQMHTSVRLQPYKPNADWHLIKDTLKNLEGMKCTE